MGATPITPLTQPIIKQTNHRNGAHSENGAAQTRYLEAPDEIKDEIKDESHDGHYVSDILPHYRAALTEMEETRQRLVAAVTARQLAEAQASAEIAARRAAEAENVRLQEEVARLRKAAS